jgi:VanZ family protein
LIAVLIEGSGRAIRVAAIAVLVGIWIPIFQVATPGTSGTLLAFVFSAVGAFVGWVIVRGIAKPPTEDGPA